MIKIAIAQINCTVGDLIGNSAKILAAAAEARAAGASLMLTPELALCGYFPEDLLFREGFMNACAEELSRLAAKVEGISLIVGHPILEEGCRYNAASLLENGKVAAVYRKRSLPNYEVFDEKRYFDPGQQPLVFEHRGVKFGLAICADIWEAGAVEHAKDAGAEVLLVPNASPFHIDKQLTRYQVARDRIGAAKIPLVYANMVGGQDELVFDGASFAMNGKGDLIHQAPAFSECLSYVEFQGAELVSGEISPPDSVEAQVYRALCLGVRDYVEKNRFPGVLLGLSGGIDSALTLAVAVDALGAQKVHAVMMPSRFTAEISIEDARSMANSLNVRYSTLPIEPMFERFLDTLADEFSGCKPDATEENIQARIRGTLLMALSNKHGSIVLTTGNKSEMAVGYSTLYGDMAGGFSLLKDIKKTLVYRLSRYRNSLGEVIPQRVIERAPSAELRADQKDQDSLPPYEVLDRVVEYYMEEDRSLGEIIALGVPETDARRVVHLIRVNEYKRRQAPVGIRVTRRGFGKDWRYPITTKFLDEF